LRKILGISAFYHDSAAALIAGRKIIAAAQEERFTREKYTAEFPVQAIKYCLEESGFRLDELDAIVFYDKPLLKFERLLETYYAFAPKGLISFLKSIPVWINEKIFLKKMIYDGLKEVEHYDKKKIKLLFSEHHLSHAASAFYVSPFDEAAILTIDGVGEWATASLGIGKGNKISFSKELHFPHSVGLLYSSFTYFLGFTVNSGEYKLMGLAPYGNAEATQTKKFIEIIKSKLVDIKDDGSIWLNMDFFVYATGLRMVPDKKWKQLFGFERRDDEDEIKQHHCNLALAIQTVTEEIVIKLAREAKRISQSDNLCMAGGVALNCVANGKLAKESLFKNIFMQPASGDAGGALGAALAINHLYFDEPRIQDDSQNGHNGFYLGPSYSEKEIEQFNKKLKSVCRKYDNRFELNRFIAEKIAKGNVIGWFQGRMEFGPRALGNRSIIADARNQEMQKKLNLKIKFREGFRPFAPAVLAEDANLYFDIEIDSPYMLFVAPVKTERRNQLPENYSEMPLWEKLYYQRSDIPSVTHLDFSSRIQTVDKEINPVFWELINEFKNQTGCSVLINTSFNVRGEPIVCTPTDAYRCFMNTEMDYLVINNFVYKKTEQPDWQNKEKWALSFKKD
jgi:carbamoyltransferase